MSKRTYCILLVDDEKDLLSRLQQTLAQNGYQIYTAESGQEALAKVVQYPIDLLVLDMMLPDISGLEVCKWVRQQLSSHLPIIMISGAGNEADKAKAFSLGANEFVTKPFDVSMFLSGIKAHLHNHQSAEPVFVAGPLKIDFLQHRVQVNEHDVQLEPIEYQILKILIDNKGRLITQDTLIHLLWPDDNQVDAGREAKLYTCIYNLRRKIDRPAQRRFIITHHHMGYRFGAEDELQAQ